MYKAIHRSLVLADVYEPQLQSKADGDDFFIKISLLTEDERATILYVKSRSE